MPNAGAPPGCSRPRKTPAQWHEIGVRLMSRKKGETNKDIAAEMNVKLRTLFRAKKRFKDHQRLQGKPGPQKGHGGATRYYDAAQHAQVDPLTDQHQTDDWDYTAEDLAHDIGAPQGPRGQWTRTVTLKDGTQELRTYIAPTERTKNRLFERAGIKAYAIENREAYNETERQKRKTFSEEHKDKTPAQWRQMFSFDEHGVYFARNRVAERQLRGKRLKVRRKKGEAQKPGCTRAKSGSNTRGGTRVGLAVTICNGRGQFLEQKKLLPSGKYDQHAYAKVVKSIAKFTRTATGKHNWARVYGIQDGHKAHWAPAAMRAARENRVTFLAGYPPRSPDLNPIENLFSMLDAHLRRLQKQHGDAANKHVFMQRVKSFFDLPSTATRINDLFNSMPTRLQKCIDVDGYATGY